MLSPFIAYLAENYVKNEPAPTEGRRARKLGLVAQFWNLPKEEKDRLAQIAEDTVKSAALADVLEAIRAEKDEDVDVVFGGASPPAGIVVRTDYSNEEAWTSFVDALKEAEKDLAAPENEDMTENTSSGSAGQPGAEGAVESESESEDEEMDADTPGAGSSSVASESAASLFAIVSPLASSPLRPRLTGISNLAALRLFNEVDAVRTPAVPAGARRVRPGNRLVDLDGFVEAYSGAMVWVYDTQSNVDRAVRVVNQRVESYGAATGDSWRARVSFLPELQLNLASGAMKIDFGGLDRWDYKERQRNIAEANSNNSE
ncbi:hypothetical protein DFH11DRAFT_1780352 [Phellopilus nigrolimitatus]|nr:hypothetical protein DFH11DRAFT_1780352 [Phellopilus nigrolimitatus]